MLLMVDLLSFKGFPFLSRKSVGLYTSPVCGSATPEAAVVMCQAIRDYYRKTGRKVGFKPAGGVRSAEDAALYYTIVEEILGKEWLTPELFRIGASSAANNLLTAIEGREVKFF